MSTIAGVAECADVQVLLLHQIMKHGYTQLRSVSVKVGTVKVADDFIIHRFVAYECAVNS